MPVTKMRSKVTDEGKIHVTMEVEIEGETKEFEAEGETLLGTIGEAFCQVIDAEIGEVSNEELLLNAVSGPYGKKMVTLRLLADHEGKRKEVVHSGEGVLESVVHGLRKMKN